MMVAGHLDDLCYILSPSYSGSTLLTFLLNTHPKIATIGELKARNGTEVGVPQRCSCGEPMRRCPFWQRVADDLQRASHPFDIRDLGTGFDPRDRQITRRLLRARIRGNTFESLRAALLRHLPDARAELARGLRRNRILVETILRLQGGEIFLDSSKDPIRLKLLLRSDHWNIKVLHLVRDGRGTARSFMKRTGMSMRSAALRFRRPHEQMKILARNLDAGRWLRIRYEDLAHQPAHAVEKVLAFLDLETGSIDLDFRAKEHHILGNPMRLGTSSRVTLDEKWRADLTTKELRIFEDIGGAMNRRLGYFD